VDAGDFPGVLRAASDLQKDVARVTGVTPAVSLAAGAPGPNAIIAGSIGKSSIIDKMISAHKIDVSGIMGQWESFLIQVVPDAAPGLASSLVIVGSDQRGTIFGVYDLSEQSGCRRGIFGVIRRWNTNPPSLSRLAGLCKGRLRSNIAAFF
jgi:hypothetical protein